MFAMQAGVDLGSVPTPRGTLISSKRPNLAGHSDRGLPRYGAATIRWTIEVDHVALPGGAPDQLLEQFLGIVHLDWLIVRCRVRY